MSNSETDGISLKVIVPIYKTKVVHTMVDGAKTPVQKNVLVKELRMKKWIRKDAITSVDEYLTSKNTIATNRALIFDRYSNKFYAVDHSKEQIMEKLSDQTRPGVGFNR